MLNHNAKSYAKPSSQPNPKPHINSNAKVQTKCIANTTMLSRNAKRHAKPDANPNAKIYALPNTEPNAKPQC